MPHLALSLLGSFEVLLDGQPVVAFKSNKVRALLAYLAVEADRPHRRAALAALLWPDWPDREALSNLRYTLASLRQAIGDRTSTPPSLLITHDTVQFNRASDHWLDVAEVERCLAGWESTRAGTSASPGTSELQALVALYRSGFLEGFSVSQAAPFEEWALLRREQIAQRVMSVLGSLVATFERRGDYPQAQVYARQQVAFEPWNEEAHRALMRALALAGERTAALHQFQTCQRILQEELGVEPSEETAALYEVIRAGPLAAGAGSLAMARQADRAPSHTTLPWAPRCVAREDLLAQLNAFLAKALTGAGRVVFVSGEAGSGKTTLLAEFARLAMHSHTNLLVASGNCSSRDGIGDPYLPFREILQLLSGDVETRRVGAVLTPEHAGRLWAAVPDAAQALVEAGPDLIDIFVPAASLEHRMEALPGRSTTAWQARLEQLRQRPPRGSKSSRSPLPVYDLFEQVTRVLQALARRHPLLLILDDLQWVDAGSLSLLFHLGRRLAGSRILVAVAYRPDAMAPQPGLDPRSFEAVIRELQRIGGDSPIDLDASEGRRFVDALLDSEPNRLDAEFRDQLFRHTEGHPLFTVELLHGLEDQGDLMRTADGCWTVGRVLHWEKLPVRIEAVIAERFARLPDSCRELLAAASVEGEEFTAEVMARVLKVDERQVLHCLSRELTERHRLVRAVSLHRAGVYRLSHYRFRHILFRQYLYDHLDSVRRVGWHEAVGSTLEQNCQEIPDELDTMAARLAWHFEVAGLAERAAAYHLRAGNRAARLSAHAEAMAHFDRGSALLEGLPETADRTRLKLALQMAGVSPLMIARGFWASERLHALEWASEIARNPVFDDRPERWLAQATVAYVAFWSAEPRRSLQLSQQLLQIAEQTQDAEQLTLAHYLVGTSWWLLGDLALSHRHLERSLAHYAQRGHHATDVALGVHVGVASLIWQAYDLWLLGYAEQGAQAMQRALAIARAGDHLTSLDLACTIAGMIYGLLGRDSAMVVQQLQSLQSLNLPASSLGAWLDILTGWVLVEEGEIEVGLAQMRRGMVTTIAVGGTVGRAMQCLFLAQGCARAGQIAAGLAATEEALAWIESTNVRLMEAEVHRTRGELLLRDQPGAMNEAAKACFRRAIDLARQQSARWWELRATVSLSRLLGTQATTPEECAHAHQMLADIYGWFREGLGTRDLQEARNLLTELTQNADLAIQVRI